MSNKLKKISELSHQEIKNLMDSIDTVLFDIDGCLIEVNKVIPGADQAVCKLRELGKKIGFVTDNGFRPHSATQTKLKPFGAKTEEIVTPNVAFLEYLRKANFKKDIFAISSTNSISVLREAGYKVISYDDIQPTKLEEDIGAVKDLTLRALEMCKNVGIILIDIDLNVQYGTMQVALTIVKNNVGVQVLTGTSEDLGAIGTFIKFIGPKRIIDALEQWGNLTSIGVAKPGKYLPDLVKSKFDITESNRVLMVGDMISSDVAFGVNAGFKTCLVLSGMSSEEQVTNWKDPEEHKPDYVAKTLADLYEKIKSL